jgi:hypothetical protein
MCGCCKCSQRFLCVDKKADGDISVADDFSANIFNLLIGWCFTTLWGLALDGPILATKRPVAYRRTFVDAGNPIGPILRASLQQPLRKWV